MHDEHSTTHLLPVTVPWLVISSGYNYTRHHHVCDNMKTHRKPVKQIFLVAKFAMTSVHMVALAGVLVRRC